MGPMLPIPTAQTTCRVVFEHLQAPALANRYQDATQRLVSVILPPGYDAEPQRRYPTIYVLAPFASAGWQPLLPAPLAESFDERLLRLYQAEPHPLPPCIVVLPDLFTALGGSQYVDSPVLGFAEQHIVRELVPFVDARFRTKPARAHRAVVGRSSGGIGALWLAMQHPEVFGAAGSHAGDGAFRLTLPPMFLSFCRIVARYGGPEKLLAHWLSLGKAARPGELFDALSILSCAASYSPNPLAALGFDLPVDVQTGEIIPAVFARWLAFDPVEQCSHPAALAALASLRLLYLDAGTRDEYFLDVATRRLSERLHQAQVPHQAEFFDDGHRGTAYRYDRSLPLLAAAIQ